MTRALPLCISIALVVALAPPASADELKLKDGNIIELTDVKPEKRQLQQGRSKQLCYVGKNEQDKLEIIDGDLVEVWIKGPTSWQKRKDNLEWYKKESAKVKNEWKAHADFAKKCSDEKLSHDLDEQAETHYRKAFELEYPTILKDDPKALLKFAEKVRDDYELYDEALTVFRSLIAARKAALVEKGPTADALVKLGKEANELELWPEAQACFEEALKLNEKHSEARKQLKELAKNNEVPLNMPLYKKLAGSFAAGVRLVKANQTPEGWFGGDFTEAGVHGRRGITGVCTYALFADYQLQKRKAMDKERAAELPKELEKALVFLMTGEDGIGKEGRLEGDDMWGAIFAAEALVMCATDEYIMAKYGPELMASIHKHIERLKQLQRNDGGWYYYNFVATSSSFSTASTLIILETLRNMGAEQEACSAMVPGAVSLIKKMKQGTGTYKYMDMGPGYHGSSSPVGASARSPLCEFALYCAENSDPDDYRQALLNWINNVEILKKIKGRSGTHIGKGSTAPYYFLYSHMYMARAVKVLPRGVANRYLRIVAHLMLGYQEKDGAWTDWKLPTQEPMKFRVSQTAMGLITLWHLMTGDRDPAVAPLRTGGVAVTPNTPTETGSGGKKKDEPEGPKSEPPKEPPKDPPKDPPKEPPKKERFEGRVTVN